MKVNDQKIDALFDAMPGGVQGFCRDYGYRQFARAVLEAAGIELEEEREKWRDIVTRAAADGNRYGGEGIAATCRPSETGALLTWTMSVPTSIGAKELIEQLAACHDDQSCPAVALAHEWLAAHNTSGKPPAGSA
jgi:hypothetical protein